MVSRQFTQQQWRREYEAVYAWCESNPAEDKLSRLDLLTPSLDDQAAALSIIHCYADVPAGTEYGLAFDPTDPNQPENTVAFVEYGVVLSRLVQPSLGHGWHQTAVIRFPEGKPKLFDRLTSPRSGPGYVGLCMPEDYVEILGSLAPTLRKT